jgi:hypothetical protein
VGFDRGFGGIEHDPNRNGGRKRVAFVEELSKKIEQRNAHQMLAHGNKIGILFDDTEQFDERGVSDFAVRERPLTNAFDFFVGQRASFDATE